MASAAHDNRLTDLTVLAARGDRDIARAAGYVRLARTAAETAQAGGDPARIAQTQQFLTDAETVLTRARTIGELSAAQAAAAQADPAGFFNAA